MQYNTAAIPYQTIPYHTAPNNTTISNQTIQYNSCKTAIEYQTILRYSHVVPWCGTLVRPYKVILVLRGLAISGLQIAEHMRSRCKLYK